MSIKNCPSCGSSEIEVAGNKVHCTGCDVTYRITEDGARVDNLDPLSKDRERLSKVEQDIEELKRGKTQTTTKNDTKDDDGENEPVGFIREVDEAEETDKNAAAGDE